jgi:hypothetical protein
MTRFTHDCPTLQRERCRATWAHRINAGLSLLCVVSFAKGDPD